MLRLRRERADEEEKLLKAEEDRRKAVEVSRSSRQEALAAKEECRKQEVEEKRLRLKNEKELAAARLRRGEFRYVRGR